MCYIGELLNQHAAIAETSVPENSTPLLPCYDKAAGMGEDRVLRAACFQVFRHDDSAIP